MVNMQSIPDIKRAVDELVKLYPPQWTRTDILLSLILRELDTLTKNTTPLTESGGTQDYIIKENK